MLESVAHQSSKAFEHASISSNVSNACFNQPRRLLLLLLLLRLLLPLRQVPPDRELLYL